jgi:hypothetical protein
MMMSKWPKKAKLIAAREELTRRGVLVDSGEKRRSSKTGELQIVWKLNPELSKEQIDALTERPEREDLS